MPRRTTTFAGAALLAALALAGCSTKSEVRQLSERQRDSLLGEYSLPVHAALAAQDSSDARAKRQRDELLRAGDGAEANSTP